MSLRLIVAYVEAKFFVIRLFFEVEMENSTVGNHMIVFLTGSVVDKVEHDPIFIGLSFNSIISRSRFVLAFHLLFLFFWSH